MSPSHEGVDRNVTLAEWVPGELGSPSHEGVDRNTSKHGQAFGGAPSPSHGGVDRNNKSAIRTARASSRPLTGAWIETVEAHSARSAAGSSLLCGNVDRNLNACYRRERAVAVPVGARTSKRGLDSAPRLPLSCRTVGGGDRDGEEMWR